MSTEKNLKIMVVDNFSPTRIILINQLRNLGYVNTVESMDGFSALARLKSALFDLVITDWSLSSMSGLDLLKKIRGDSELMHIPVLMITPEDFKGNMITAIKAGLNDYIVRPYEYHKFKNKLEKIFH
ncbi:MAG: hypothetical protein CL935_01275 [Deltaproteobacteria bacterium]|nr:hypothetical protein [Deltaproteobacteria bacterium]|tara:strand:- start:2407 stop:2787 length:381 start_codon:yes stop_codon:yes gene_type:complete